MLSWDAAGEGSVRTTGAGANAGAGAAAGAGARAGTVRASAGAGAAAESGDRCSSEASLVTAVRREDRPAPAAPLSEASLADRGS
eukprot:COSAG01_NODE_67472_length_267_cov_0.559524_1_plen_84_part_10